MPHHLRNQWPVFALLAAFPLWGLSGCASDRRHLSDDFGETYFQGVNAQIVNPAAPVNAAPADTLPGEVAQKIYNQRYVKSMTEKKEEKDDVASELGN